MEDTIPPLAYNVQTLRRASGLGRSTIHEDIASGRLKARKLGAKLVILHEDAKAWLDSLPTRQPSKKGVS